MKRFRYTVIVLLTMVVTLSSCDFDVEEFVTSFSPSEETAEPGIEYGEPIIPEQEPVIPVTGGNSTDNLSVYFIDVGQGDCILIDHGETEVLIDGGDRSPGVVDALAPYVDGNIDIMVATHVHADHIGGLIDVLREYEVGEIWHSGETAASVTYNNFTALVEAENATVCIGRVGDVISAGDLSFLVVSPVDDAGSTNNDSLVLLLTYGTVDFLFTGDAEIEAEEAMLASSVIDLIDIDILKVGHHASRTASSPAFIDVIKPEVCIYMAKTGNTYGHPHEETITTLTAAGASIYGTDVSGTIVVTTDGTTYTVVPSRVNLN
jgi:beta-lactamase superfamily II metal-dependent hydrolase